MNTKIILLTIISGLSTVFGCVILLISKKYKNKVLSFSFGLSCSVMFLISILELIHEGISYGISYMSIPIIFIVALIIMLSGGGVVKLLDKYSKSDNDLYNVGLLCMLSILIHNIPEGIITSISLATNYEFGLKMLLIILIHNIPEGISICAPIYYSGKSIGLSLLYAFISGAGEVVGALLGISIFRFINIDILMFVMLLATAGIMIYLSIGKLFIEGIKLSEDNYLLYGIVLGLIIILITV